jgi:hypothetical protein
LTAAGFSVDFRLQGSVPLNVHIRGVSDVDLLNLDTNFLTYATQGSLSLAGNYVAPSTKTSLTALTTLRIEAEKILKTQYPAATVDTSGGKAINIYGGSLARPVDVVPSHWYDTIDYQSSKLEHHRAITILNKKVPECIDNLPFMHIKLIDDKDALTRGCIKKSIRLCKNVKSDAEGESNTISLPSFDIAAMMYHANFSTLGSIYELSILAETQRHLDVLARNQSHAKSLKVPDGSRFIFDTQAKLEGLCKLSEEIDDLFLETCNEQGSLKKSLSGMYIIDESRKALGSVFLLPAA